MALRQGRVVLLLSWPILAWVALSDFLLVGVLSASSFNNAPDPAFMYTLEVDYTSDVEDEEDEGFPTYLESELLIQEIESPLTHEGAEPSMPGCFVTTRAFLRDTVQPCSMDLRSFYRTEDDDDDDDDNDDDGHSSMLSNRSLRRSSTSMPANTKEFRQSAKTALLLRGGSANFASKALSSDMSKKLFVTALVTLVFEGCMGHILEFLKISLQTAQTDSSYLKVIQDITAEKGIAGLWDGKVLHSSLLGFAHTLRSGFVPWGVVQAVFKGAVFGLAHAAATKALVPAAKEGKLPMALALTLAGGIGGGFQGYVLSPTLLLKTRVMTNSVFREKMSLMKTTLLSFRVGYDVVKTEGLATLMKGANVFATKRVFDWSSRYFFANLFEDMFAAVKASDLSIGEKSIASLLGGVASTCLTLPLDVLVAKTQDAKKAGVKVSALSLFMDELREKGAKGLSDAYLRGFTARLLHVCLTTVVVKTGTPIVYEELFGTSNA